MKPSIVCTKCGTSGKPKMAMPGSELLLLFLLLCGIFPGFIYAVYRLTNRYPICKVCKSREVIGVDTPIGKNLINKIKEGAI